MKRAPRDPDAAVAALELRRLGWSVVPLKHGLKLPLIPWLEYQQRPPEEDEIRSWFERWPDANLAIVTGRASGVVVLDSDPRHRGDESLQALESEHGTLPPTVEAISGGGGRHLYFAPGDALVRSRVGFAPGLDLKGEGGLVVAPPSVHPSGGRYAWRSGHAPGEIAPAPVPDWVLALDRADAAKRGHPLQHWRDLVRDGVGEGARNQTVASLTGHLLWHGVDPDVALELLLAWNRVRCRPPLPDDEVARTVASIVRTHTAHAGEF